MREKASIVLDAPTGTARVAHGLWEMEIPIAGADDVLAKFIRREADVASLLRDSQWSGFAQLLDRIGALTMPESALKSTRGLLTLHSALLVEWFAEHYGLEFWQILALGRATRGQVEAWIARTYFLSRSVGASASTGALFATDPACRAIFLKNALEEYDHCQVFYGNGGPVSIDFASINQPAISRAIDIHYRSLGESDQWGHALSALYQERTAMFARDAVASYDALQRTYELEGSFKGWKDHLGVDCTQDHAGDFSGIFEVDRALDRTDGLIALTHAWVSAQLLRTSIEQLQRGERSVAPKFGACEQYANRRLQFIFLKALSHAVVESDLVAFGDMLSALRKIERDQSSPSDWSVGLHGVLALNDLQSAAADPTAFTRAIGVATASGMFRVFSGRLEANVPARSRWLLTDAGMAPTFPLDDCRITLSELLGGSALAGTEIVRCG